MDEFKPVLFFAAILVVIFAWGLKDTPLGFSFRLNMPADGITVEDQPHDCDWMTAPLGSKHCHYEPVIDKANGVAVVTWRRVQD